MKNEMIQKMTMAINALNNVTVSGEQNMQNLLGSIAIMREIVDQMQKEAAARERRERPERRRVEPETEIESETKTE